MEYKVCNNDSDFSGDDFNEFSNLIYIIAENGKVIYCFTSEDIKGILNNEKGIKEWDVNIPHNKRDKLLKLPFLNIQIDSVSIYLLHHFRSFIVKNIREGRYRLIPIKRELINLVYRKEVSPEELIAEKFKGEIISSIDIVAPSVVKFTRALLVGDAIETDNSLYINGTLYSDSRQDFRYKGKVSDIVLEENGDLKNELIYQSSSENNDTNLNRNEVEEYYSDDDYNEYDSNNEESNIDDESDIDDESLEEERLIREDLEEERREDIELENILRHYNGSNIARLTRRVNELDVDIDESELSSDIRYNQLTAIIRNINRLLELDSRNRELQQLSNRVGDIKERMRLRLEENVEDEDWTEDILASFDEEGNALQNENDNSPIRYDTELTNILRNYTGTNIEKLRRRVNELGINMHQIRGYENIENRRFHLMAVEREINHLLESDPRNRELLQLINRIEEIHNILISRL